MAIKVAINGFGRIGRMVLRALQESGRDDISVVAINDLAPPETLAMLFEFDSVHGRFDGTVKVEDGTMDVGSGPIRVTAIRTPEELPWNDVDIAFECTGLFTTDEKAGKLLEAGAKKVLISAPGKGEMKTVVFGVNHTILTADDKIVSNGSCTTNCLAPVAQVLNDSFGVKRGTMTTVHAYTGNQPTHDTASTDISRLRAAALSIIPTSTGAAKAIGLVLPELDGKIFGTAMRVPTANVSVVDLTVEVETETSTEAVNAALTAAAEGRLAGILDVECRPLVSADFNHWPASSIAALEETHVQDKTMIRVMSWYDNEWGFSNRMLDVAAHMGGL